MVGDSTVVLLLEDDEGPLVVPTSDFLEEDLIEEDLQEEKLLELY